MSSNHDSKVSIQRCLWDETAIPKPSFAPLEGDCSADVVIVGGGLTGLRTALGLAEAGVEVALLDAKHLAWGGSGRSLGQCNPIWRATPDQLQKKFGSTLAERLIATTLSSADDLFDDIKRYNIACDATQKGWVQAAHSLKAEKALVELYQGWTQAGARIETLSGDEITNRTGSKGEYRFALLHKTGGTVHPLSMTRGFANAANAHGVRIHEHSPATDLKRTGPKWQVSTPGGSISAERVVLATNAYTDNLLPGLKKTILPMFSIILATNPLSPEQQAQILPGGISLSDSRNSIYAVRLDRHKRLLFGGIGSGERVDFLGGTRRLQSGLKTVFPDLEGIETPYRWAGRIAMSPDLMPHMYEPHPGLHAVLGYTGRGIVNTSVMARALVKRILGASEPELPFPVLPLKPIPLHGLIKPLIPLTAPLLPVLDKLG